MRTAAEKKAYFKAWYAKNRERMIQKARAADLAYPEKAKQRKRAYVERHPEKRKEINRRYMNKPEVRERQRLLRSTLEQREKSKQRREQYRDALHDCYVRRCLSQKLGIKGSDLPQNLVDAHCELIRLKRAINEKL